VAESAMKKKFWEGKPLKVGLILFATGLVINSILVSTHIGGLFREAARLLILLGLLTIAVRICLTWWGLLLVLAAIGIFAWNLKDDWKIIFGERKQTQSLSQPVQDLIREGAILAKGGNYDSAISKFQEALQVDPNVADTYFYIGLAESQLGNQDKALDYYEQAIQKNPHHFNAYKQSAMIYVEQKEDQKAHKYFIKALLANPRDGESMYHLGVLEIMRNQFEAAERWFWKADREGYVIPDEKWELVKKGLEGKAKIVKEPPDQTIESVQKINKMLAQVPGEVIEPYLKERDPNEKFTPISKLTTAQRDWAAIKKGMSMGQVMGLLGNPDLVKKSYAGDGVQIQLFYGNGIVTLINDRVSDWQSEA